MNIYTFDISTYKEPGDPPKDSTVTIRARDEVEARRFVVHKEMAAGRAVWRIQNQADREML